MNWIITRQAPNKNESWLRIEGYYYWTSFEQAKKLFDDYRFMIQSVKDENGRLYSFRNINSACFAWDNIIYTLKELKQNN